MNCISWSSLLLCGKCFESASPLIGELLVCLKCDMCIESKSIMQPNKVKLDNHFQIFKCLFQQIILLLQYIIVWSFLKVMKKRSTTISEKQSKARIVSGSSFAQLDITEKIIKYKDRHLKASFLNFNRGFKHKMTRYLMVFAIQPRMNSVRMAEGILAVIEFMEFYC